MPRQQSDTIRLVPAGLPYNRAADPNKDQRFVNCYPETVKSPLADTKKTWCQKRSGTTLFSTITGASGEGRGIFYWQDLQALYTVWGNKVYRDNTDLGITLTTVTGKVGFTNVSYGLKKYLFFCDGAKGYVIDKDAPSTVVTIGADQVQSISITSGGSGYSSPPTVSITGGGGSGATATATISSGQVVSIKITNRGSGYTIAPTVSFSGGGGTGAAATAFLSAFPTPHIPNPVYMDGYILLARVGTSDVYNSGLGDFTSWDALDFITVNQFPGDCTGLSRQRNQIVVFKEDSVEFIYNAGNAAGSPFSRTPQAVGAYGAASASSIADNEDFVFFVGKTNIGTVGVWVVEGFKEEKISTEAIDRTLANEGSNIDLATGYLVRTQGHFFYVLRLAGGRTLVYDEEERYWHEWTTVLAGVESNFFGAWGTAIGTTPIIQKSSGNTTYAMASTVYQDDGQPINTVYRSIKVDMDNRYRKWFNALEIVADEQSSTSTLTIDASDDDYKTWHGNWSVDLSKRAYVKNLGSARARAWRLTHQANTPFRFEALEMVYKQGTH